MSGNFLLSKCFLFAISAGQQVGSWNPGRRSGRRSSRTQNRQARSSIGKLNPVQRRIFPKVFCWKCWMPLWSVPKKSQLGKATWTFFVLQISCQLLVAHVNCIQKWNCFIITLSNSLQGCRTSASAAATFWGLSCQTCGQVLPELPFLIFDAYLQFLPLGGHLQVVPCNKN